MFSCVVAGRLPLPPPQQIDATHAVFQLEQADQINHIVVFMTGQQAFPEGYGATVHLMWPKEDMGANAQTWQLLGWYAHNLGLTDSASVCRTPSHRLSSGSETLSVTRCRQAWCARPH